MQKRRLALTTGSVNEELARLGQIKPIELEELSFGLRNFDLHFAKFDLHLKVRLAPKRGELRKNLIRKNAV